MFCSRCGTSLAEGTTFCTKCGAPIGSLAPPAAANAPVAAPPAAYPQAGAIAPPPGAVPMMLVPTVPYAGFWLRFVAYLLDVIIVGIVAVPIVVVLAVAHRSELRRFHRCRRIIIRSRRLPPSAS